MADNSNSDPDKTVQLTPEAPKAEPRLAVVRPGPKAVTVSVPSAKPVPKEPQPSEPPQVKLSGGDDDVVKKGALIDEVVAATGVKRADAKSVSEALLAALAEQLQAGKTLQLPPLGRVKLVKEKDVGQGAKALTVKIRTPNAD